MARILRSGLAPGQFAGEPLIFNITTNQFVPASKAPVPTGAAAIYDVRSLLALADGAEVLSWPDSSGNGLDLPDPGVARRPIYRVDAAGDGVAGVLFDGAAVNGDFMRVAVPVGAGTALTIYFVAETGPSAGAPRTPLSLGRAAVLSNAGGCARLFLDATTFALGSQANNLGGATVRSAGYDAATTGAPRDSAGWFGRRAYAFRWMDRAAASATSFWVQSSYLGDNSVHDSLGATPQAPFSYTTFCLGSENNGGGAPLDPYNGAIQFASYYQAAHTERIIHQELLRLRAIFGAY